jgi:orotate phosphoribosyltransferase-like protein
VVIVDDTAQAGLRVSTHVQHLRDCTVPDLGVCLKRQAGRNELQGLGLSSPAAASSGVCAVMP